MSYSLFVAVMTFAGFEDHDDADQRDDCDIRRTSSIAPESVKPSERFVVIKR